jgi:hypothetical protein
VLIELLSFQKGLYGFLDTKKVTCLLKLNEILKINEILKLNEVLKLNQTGKFSERINKVLSKLVEENDLKCFIYKLLRIC